MKPRANIPAYTVPEGALPWTPVKVFTAGSEDGMPCRIRNDPLIYTGSTSQLLKTGLHIPILVLGCQILILGCQGRLAFI